MSHSNSPESRSMFDFLNIDKKKAALGAAALLAAAMSGEVAEAQDSQETPDPNVRYTSTVLGESPRNIRANPDTSGRVLGTIPGGTVLEISIDVTNDNFVWARIWATGEGDDRVELEEPTYIAIRTTDGESFLSEPVLLNEEGEVPAVAAPEAPTDSPVRETEAAPEVSYESVDDILNRLGVENVEDLAHPELFEDIIYQQSLELPNGQASRFAIVANRETFEEGGRTLYSPEMTQEANDAIQNYFNYMWQDLGEIEGDFFVPTADNNVLGSTGSSEAVEFVQTDLSNIIFVLTPDATRGDLLYHVGNSDGETLGFAWRPEPGVNGSGVVIYLNIDDSSHRSLEESTQANQYFVGSVFLTGSGVVREAIELQLEHTNEEGEPQLLSMAADWASYYRGPGINPWTEWANEEPQLRSLFADVAETVTPVPEGE